MEPDERADDGFTGNAFTDEELTELALAAGPDEALEPDAVPFEDGGRAGLQLLPAWYMPAATSSLRSPRRATVASIVILAFLAVNAVGLCTTYGFPEIAW